MELKTTIISCGTFCKQFLRFGVVGFGNFLVDASIFNALLFFTTPLTPFLVFILIRVIAGGCAILHSYVWNRIWVFKSNEPYQKTVVPFLVTSIIGIGINTATFSILLWYFKKVSEIELWILANIAFLLAIVFSLVWNFIMYRYVVFKKEN